MGYGGYSVIKIRKGENKKHSRRNVCVLGERGDCSFDQVQPRKNPTSTFLSLRLFLFIHEGWSENGVLCSMHLMLNQ